MAKNRIFIDDNEKAPPSGPRVYLDEGSSTRFRLTTWAMIALAIAVITGVALYYSKDIPLVKQLGLAETIQEGAPGKRNIGPLKFPQGGAKDESISAGISLFNQGKFNAAREQLLQSVKTVTDKGDLEIAYIYLGIIHLEKKAEYMRAARSYNKALEVNPKSALALSHLARAYFLGNYLDEARKAAKKAKELDPDSTDSAALLANIESELGNDEAARENYQEILDKEPDNPKALYDLAITNLKAGRNADAVSGFRRVVGSEKAGNVLKAMAHNQLGSYYYNQNNFESALDHYRSAAAIDKNNSRIAYNIGLVYFRQDKQTEALAAFKTALSKGAPSFDVHIQLGKVFSKLNKPKLAVKALEKAIQLRPSNMDALFGMGEAYYRAGRLDKAEQIYNQIASYSTSAANKVEALNNRGVILDEMGRPDQAIKVFNQALEYNSNDAGVQQNLGVAYHNNGQTDRAIEIWRRAGGNQHRKRIADVLFDAGSLREARNEYRTFLKSYDEDDDGPKDFDYYQSNLRLGEINFKVGLFNDAITRFEKVQAAKDYPRLRQMAYLRLGLVFVHPSQARYEEARSVATQGAQVFLPGNLDAKLVYCQVLAETNDPNDREKAISELTRLSMANADTNLLSEAFNLLGVLYYKNGETRRALVSFRHSLDLDPQNKKAFENQRLAQSQLSGAY